MAEEIVVDRKIEFSMDQEFMQFEMPDGTGLRINLATLISRARAGEDENAERDLMLFANLIIGTSISNSIASLAGSMASLAKMLGEAATASPPDPESVTRTAMETVTNMMPQMLEMLNNRKD